MRRVLILGGGCGGVAAAWALSRTPELRRAVSVTLVQPGGRLGGKGATHRDPGRSEAILEHGLHMWLGWYRTAFSMMQDVYEAWDGPTRGPQASLGDAFTPQYDVSLVGPEGTPADTWHLTCPKVPGVPWDSAGPTQTWMQTVSTWTRRMPGLMRDDAPANQRRVMAGLTMAIGRGLAAEWRRHGADCFAQMDALDLRAWLRVHGASEEVATSAPLRGLYDLGFAYPEGVAGPDRGQAAAGTALKVLLNMFASYRGAPFWRMNAGMGDTVFAPAFEVLRARGVDVRFYQAVTALRTDGRSVTQVELGHQARGVEGHDPLVDLGDLRVWPGEPRRDPLSELATGDLEAAQGPFLSGSSLTIGDDFDDVVLAIPATAHGAIAADLMAANPRYRAMVEHTHGVATIAAQCWLDRGTRQLGWDGTDAVLTGMNGPFHTWADLTGVLPAEGWQDPPAGLAYLCGVAPPEVQRMTDRQAASAWVREQLPDATRSLLPWWPGADAGGHLDESALRDGWPGQYARANVAPWERYVLSLPGTMSFRLAPGDSGFSNLFLAGDWTKNRVNGGSVEGAVDSGVAAAHAVLASC